MLFLLGTAYVAFAPDIIATTDDMRSVATTEAGKTCTTDGAGACTISLGGETYKFDTEGMTVTETSPGSADRTSQTTVSADRTEITIASLSPTTGYTFTIVYQAIDTDLTIGFATALGLVPIVFIVVMVASIVLGLLYILWQRRAT